MRESIFSYVYWLFAFLSELSFHILCPLFYWVIHFFLILSCEFFVNQRNLLYDSYCKCFFLVCHFSFHLFIYIYLLVYFYLPYREVFNLYKCRLIVFFYGSQTMIYFLCNKHLSDLIMNKVVLVHLGCYNKMPDWAAYQQQNFICHQSGCWEIQG